MGEAEGRDAGNGRDREEETKGTGKERTKDERARRWTATIISSQIFIRFGFETVFCKVFAVNIKKKRLPPIKYVFL